MRLRDHIEIRSEKRFGKPIIKGTRIAVSDVLNWLALGFSRVDGTEHQGMLSFCSKQRRTSGHNSFVKLLFDQNISF
jgi:hypothetical protein